MADKDDSADPARTERQERLGKVFDDLVTDGVIQFPVKDREGRLTPDEMTMLRLYRGLAPQRLEGFNLALTMLRLAQ